MNFELQLFYSRFWRCLIIHKHKHIKLNYFVKLLNYLHATIRMVIHLPYIRFLSFCIAMIIANTLSAQWFSLNSGTTTQLRAIEFTSADTGFVVGYNGTILKTLDGTSWLPLSSGTVANLTSIDFISDSIGYVCGSAGTILKTVDCGITWSPQFSGTLELLSDIFFLDSLNGYIVGANGTCLKTTDGGSNWLPINLGSNDSKLSVFFHHVDTGFVAGDGTFDAVMGTTDGGQTWDSLHSASFREFTSVFFVNRDTGYIVSAVFGEVFQTTNAGVTWTLQTGIGTALYSITFPSALVGYTVGGTFSGNSYIMQTNTGGAFWNFQISPVNSMLFDVYFLNDTVGYSVGLNGSIIKTLNGGTNSIEENRSELISNCYPNPASTSLCINLGEHSTNGVWSLSNSFVVVRTGSINSDTFLIDVSELPSGHYCLRISNNEISSVKKIVIVH